MFFCMAILATVKVKKIVFAPVHSVLQSCEFIEIIHMNFLLPGHTTMPVDSVHALIERSIDNMNIYAPSQWPTVFELARKNPKPYIQHRGIC